SGPHGPVVDVQPAHREVPGVFGRQPRSDSDRSRRNETVRLSQGPAAAGELPAPNACTPPLVHAERCQAETGEQASGRRLLRRAEAAHRRLDVDRADVQLVARGAMAGDARARVRTTAGRSITRVVSSRIDATQPTRARGQ